MSDSAATEPGELLVEPTELKDRLSRELELTDWRAIVVVVVAEPELGPEIERAREDVLHHRALSDAQVVVYDTRQDEAGRKRLTELNRARDSLLKKKRLIWLSGNSAADVRFLRETAPDLLSAIDLFVEVRSEGTTSADWAICRQKLCDLMEERHGILDFAGLLPAIVDHRVLPLVELYQPMVEFKFASLRLGPNAPPGLLVLGHPGTGKTTYVRHLAWTYASGNDDPFDAGSKVPLLVSLSDYGHMREQDRTLCVLDFLPRWLKIQEVSRHRAITEHLPEVLLLLDGLDELRSPELRHAVLCEMSRIIRDGSIGGVVITGRSYLADELVQEEYAFHIIFTRRAKLREIRAFLTSFATADRSSRATIANLRERIERDPDLLDLAGNPLILVFMTILSKYEGRLPDRRIEIYYRLGEMLVDRWTKACSLGSRKYHHDRPTRAETLRMLGSLAWSSVERGGKIIREDQLIREIQHIEAKHETTEEASRRALAVLDRLRRDTALLVPHSEHQWRFIHSSIVEYFAGVHVERDHARWKALLSDPFRPEWREIVLFCAGQLGVIDGRTERLNELVDAVLSKTHANVKNPSLLIGFLKEMPGISMSQFERFIAPTLDMLTTTKFSSGAARQMQGEFVEIVANSHGTAAKVLEESLRSHLSEKASVIQWDYLFVAGTWLDYFGGTMVSIKEGDASSNAFTTMGPFMWWVCTNWANFYSPTRLINPEPILAAWRTQSDWRYRFAEWLIKTPPKRHNRPFTEVARVLGIELA